VLHMYLFSDIHVCVTQLLIPLKSWLVSGDVSHTRVHLLLTASTIHVHTEYTYKSYRVFLSAIQILHMNTRHAEFA